MRVGLGLGGCLDVWVGCAYAFRQDCIDPASAPVSQSSPGTKGIALLHVSVCCAPAAGNSACSHVGRALLWHLDYMQDSGDLNHEIRLGWAWSVLSVFAGPLITSMHACWRVKQVQISPTAAVDGMATAAGV